MWEEWLQRRRIRREVEEALQPFVNRPLGEDPEGLADAIDGVFRRHEAP